MIAIGLRANISMKPTSGFAMELGYLVTLVKKATAAFGTDRTHAANELNGPNFCPRDPNHRGIDGAAAARPRRAFASCSRGESVMTFASKVNVVRLGYCQFGRIMSASGCW
jgi:hypothetical protein